MFTDRFPSFYIHYKPSALARAVQYTQNSPERFPNTDLSQVDPYTKEKDAIDDDD
jgi:hypothetical protein